MPNRTTVKQLAPRSILDYNNCFRPTRCDSVAKRLESVFSWRSTKSTSRTTAQDVLLLHRFCTFDSLILLKNPFLTISWKNLNVSHLQSLKIFLSKKNWVSEKNYTCRLYNLVRLQTPGRLYFTSFYLLCIKKQVHSIVWHLRLFYT